MKKSKSVKSGSATSAKPAKYDPAKIEAKWQKKWDLSKLYGTDDFSEKEKFYCLVEFPYPSGEGLHIGHAFTMTGADIFARKKRMEDCNVLFPIGWDAFGLPTENYALKKGIHPAVATKKNTDRFREQMKELAFSFDWSREVNTTDPKYYKWTQWIFIKLFEKGLAYKEERPINWCPSCKTGLANEEVINGKCERCGADVTKKNLSQWIVKITDYADRLIDGLKKTDFIEKVKAAQINWIDRKLWIDISYQIDGTDEEIIVSTTRPDTNFGATFVVLAPEHELFDDPQKIPKKYRNKVYSYIKSSLKKSELERLSEAKVKTGEFTGLYCINGLNGTKMPIYVTDFVLKSVGTGAVVGVPGHDIRDFEFAQKFDLPVIRVVEWDGDDKGPIDSVEKVREDLDGGKMVNSEFLNGLTPRDALKKIMNFLEEKKMGKKTIRYHLRDWIFSRQHYWGEPIPMIHCEKCGWVTVPENELPIELPDIEEYQPTDTGESPLANIKEWVETKCPKCGGSARRETDTMPNWAGSDWYFMRYIDPDNDKEFADMKKMKHWMPVNLYIGGDEHNTLHMLYSRFIYQFLWDIGAVPKEVPEPYYRRISHGVILGPDGQRMSKSRGNVIVPDEIVKKYSVDVVRMYLMFIGPFEGTMAWNDNALKGVERFINRLWSYVKEKTVNKSDKSIEVIVNKLVHKVTKDLDNFQFNTAIASMMESLNEIEDKDIGKNEASMIAQLVAPFAPYLAEELWEILGENGSVHESRWPEVDESVLKEENFEVPVQVNGKVRGRVEISKGMSEEAIRENVMALENVKKYIGSGKIKKFLYVPERIVTVVL